MTGALKRILGTKDIYGDSVPGYTPLTVNVQGETITTTFDELSERLQWMPYGEHKEMAIVGMEGMGQEYFIPTHDGWIKVIRFIRHKGHGKAIHRFTTRSGLVDVTEDHSLLDRSGRQVKPDDVNLHRMDLMSTPAYCHKHPCTNWSGCDPRQRQCTVTSQLAAEKTRLFLLGQGVNSVFIRPVYTGRDGDGHLYHLKWSWRQLQMGGDHIVNSHRVVCREYDDYVYDVETLVGSFNAGVGDIVIKNTDSCFTYIDGLDALEMAKQSPEWIYNRLKFKEFGMLYNQFKEDVYEKYFPTDMTCPRSIREACGGIVHQLYTLIAPILSTEVLELEPEKTLTAITIKSMKKYTAHNCCTKQTLTKGMSLHNKAAFPITSKILTKYNDLCINMWTKWELARDLYNYLGAEITVPIELGLVDPRDIARPCSFDLKKVLDTSKRGSLIKSLKRDGVYFSYEKIRILQVTIYPEGVDEDWSLCDILNQSCEGRVHVIKVKYDVLNEIMGTIGLLFKQGVCSLFEALIWGEFHFDRFTAEDCEEMDRRDSKEFRPLSFGAIMKKASPVNVAHCQTRVPPVPKPKTRKRKSAHLSGGSAPKKNAPDSQSIMSFFHRADNNMYAGLVSKSLVTGELPSSTVVEEAMDVEDVPEADDKSTPISDAPSENTNTDTETDTPGISWSISRLWNTLLNKSRAVNKS